MFVGLATLDLVHHVESIPSADQKVTASHQYIAAGGPAANAAVTFAALGGWATLVTSLGGHVLGRLAAADLGEYDVSVLDATPHRLDPPPVSSVAVDVRGSRAVSSVNGTGPVAAPTDLAALVVISDFVLVDGHHPGLAVPAARAAHERDVPVVLDGGSWKPAIEELLPFVDIAVCSADFAVPGARDAAAALLDRGVPVVVVTAGAAPVRWWAGGAGGEVEVPRVVAVDTAGAGDAFHGALLYALGQLPPGDGTGRLVRALTFAAAVASLRCGIPGPRAWLADPRLPELAGALRGVPTGG